MKDNAGEISDTIYKLIAMFNLGHNLMEISEALGYSVSNISRILNRLVEKGIVSKYLSIFIDRLRPPPTVLVVEYRQKCPEKCVHSGLRRIITYFSFAGRPVEIHYINEELKADDIDSNVNTSICRILFYGKVLDVLIPFERIEEKGIELYKTVNIPGLDKLDEIDELILIDMFRLFNPCTLGNWKVNDLLSILSKRLGISNLHHHYYRHIHKLLHRRLVLRGGGEYVILFTINPGISGLEKLLNELIHSGILIGIDQVNLINRSPCIALVHGWGNLSYLYDPIYMHRYVEDSSYIFYPVLAIYF
ncbi:MAG: helix-turn-helix domain-containing protein [Desulfurococcaceae archaeon]